MSPKIPALLLVLSTLGTSCALLRGEGALDEAGAPVAVDRAEAALAEGDSETALEVLLEVRGLESLNADLRSRQELLLERAARDEIVRLEAAGERPALVDLFEEDDLPARLQVQAGVAAARVYLSKGHAMRAFRLIRRIDATFETHSERRAAGRVVAEAGHSLAYDDGNELLFFPKRRHAPQVIEYLLLYYPADPYCEEGYMLLASIYEADRRWLQAMLRYEDLVVFHPSSEFVPAARARIPYLRLVQLTRPEYDRFELERAEEELVFWLEQYPDHEMQPHVSETLDACRRRLVESDLSIARFYRKVENAFGARLHAERALTRARGEGLEDLAGEAAGVLASLPAEGSEAQS